MRIGTLHANCGCGFVAEAHVEEARLQVKTWEGDDDKWAAVQQSLNSVLYQMMKHVRETGHKVEITGNLSTPTPPKKPPRGGYEWLDAS